jgi:hypothetical protein
MNLTQFLRHSALGVMALGAVAIVGGASPAQAGGCASCGGVTDTPVPGVTDCPVPGTTDAPVPGTTDSPVPGHGHGHGKPSKTYVRNHRSVDKAKALAEKLKQASAKCSSSSDCGDVRALMAQSKAHLSTLQRSGNVAPPRGRR